MEEYEAFLHDLVALRESCDALIKRLQKPDKCTHPESERNPVAMNSDEFICGRCGELVEVE